jgi:dTDP-glucose 4,6-dehydratase
MPKMKKVNYLVMGSNSFSGSNFIDYLLNKNCNVVGISRSKELQKDFLTYKSNKNLGLFTFKKIDINKNVEYLKKIVLKYKPSIVVNYIAQGMVAESWLNPEDWYKTNIVSQTLIYKELAKFKFIKKFIHVSTPEVYGSTPKKIKESYNFNPSTPYAISRATMDSHLYKFFKNYKLPIIFTRTSNVYGPGQQLYRIIPKTFMCSKKKIKLKLHGGGKSLRSFIHILDASKATYLISQKGKIGETYHISTNEFLTIQNLVRKIAKLENISFKKLCKIEIDRIGKDHSYKLNSSKLIKKLGWKPSINVDQGLLLTKKWIDDSYIRIKKLRLQYQHRK